MAICHPRYKKKNGHITLGQLLINHHIIKVFNTTFISNIKKLSEKLIILSFFYKIFLQMIPKSMP